MSRRPQPLAKRCASVATMLAALATIDGDRVAATDSAPWVQVRSANSVVISDAGTEMARTIAVAMEDARAGMLSVVGGSVTEPGEPVVVIALRNTSGLKELLPQFWERRGPRPAAAASPGPYTPYIALRTDVSEPVRRRLVVHEYVHLLTRDTIDNVPAWLDEGLSDFWAAQGGVRADYLRRLRWREWIPMQELLATERGQYGTNSGRAQQLYAQSWALVHFLLRGQDQATQIAFAPAVPEDAVQVEKQLKAYVAAGVRATPLDLRTATNTSVEVEQMSAASAMAWRGAFLVHGERRTRAMPLLETALAENPRNQTALEALGTLYFLENRHDLARRWFKEALDIGGASYRTHYYYAVLSPEPALAEEYLQKTLKLRPGFQPALDRLSQLK